jgi:hypothetical protein
VVSAPVINGTPRHSMFGRSEAGIKATLLRALENENVDRLSELVGMDAAAVTAEDWPR